MADRFKSIFISLVITYAIIIFCIHIFQLMNTGLDYVVLSSMMVHVLIIFYFAKIFLIETPRTSHSMMGYTVFSAVALVAAIVAHFMFAPNPQALLFSILGFIFWLIYVFWATDFSTRNSNALEIGNPMPNVELKDINGQSIQLSNYFDAPAILLFYRGNWCPFCMAQIREISKEYQRIKEKGANLIFISPQSPKHTKSLASKFDIPAIFLIDEDLKAAKKLDIFNAFGTPLGMEVLGYDTDNVYPTLVVTDQKGIIRFADLTDNYRVRPEPEMYLNILDQIAN